MLRDTAGPGSGPAVILVSRLPDEPSLESRYPVCDIVCEDPFDYWRGVQAEWVTDRTIVNVEHDMEYSDTLIDQLLACPQPLCAHAYQMHLPATFWAHQQSTVAWYPPIDPCSQFFARGVRQVKPGDEHADWSGIGFCKITPAVRIAPLRRDAWQGVEMSVHAAIRGRWHLHWPGVEHHHH